ncbi:hypothetical protein TNCV_2726451 [Trichonephila clavipes]|nr:hypothetical protein TNCV_2726451 [Trichonephila clavipes]
MIVTSLYSAARELLMMDLVILNHGQVTRTLPELVPSLLNSTPHQKEDRCIFQRTIDKYSACVEVGKPIDENSACVEVEPLTNTCEEVTNRTTNDITCEEDLIRIVENLDGTVESTDTIVKLKTKIENSSTFESDPDFVKTLIQNCIDERVSRNEREVTLGKQKIELAKLQLAQLEKEVELQRVKNKALSLNPAAKVEEKQFETLNKETATHIGIREAEDWFRPIDLAKECDIYISSRSGSHKEIPITLWIYPRPL